MATVNIKLSQSAIDVNNALDFGFSPRGTLSIVVDRFVGLLTAFRVAYPEKNLYFSTSESIWKFYPGISNDVTAFYTGVVKADPNAKGGAATATGWEFNFNDGSTTYVQSGLTNLNYSIDQNTGSSFSSTGGVSTSLKLTKVIPPTEIGYLAVLGTRSTLLDGSVYLDANQILSGSISKITETPEKALLSTVIEGDFKVSGDADKIWREVSSSNVSGLLTSFKSDSRDGSYFHVTDISTFISTTQIIDERIFADASRFSGDDVFNVDLPSTLYSDYFISSGLGNDRININGGGGRLNVNAGAGNDIITIGLDNHAVDGGAGFDTAIFTGSRSSFTINQNAATTTVSSKTGTNGIDSLTNIERIQFSDASVAFDINGTAGQAYRVYQAAFNRKPDLAGLSYWINDMDKGSSLTSVAAGFFQSPEFKALYGSNKPTNNVLITNLYLNVLHRPLDQAGFDYWAGQLKSGVITQAGVLASFSESAENQLQVLAAIQNGIDYISFQG